MAAGRASRLTPTNRAPSSMNGASCEPPTPRARTRVPRRRFSSIALDRDNVESGVLAANIRLERTHFRKERLDRLHIGELRRVTPSGGGGPFKPMTLGESRGMESAEGLAAAFFYVGSRLGGKITEVADPILDIDFGPDKCRWLGLRVQDA